MRARFIPVIEGLGLGLLGLVLPLVFYPHAEDAYRLPQLSALALAVFCLCLAWSEPLARGRGPLLAALFFGWRLVSHLAAGFQAAWLSEQALYALLFFWAASHLHNAARASRLKAALLAGAALAAAYSLLQSFGADPLAAGRLDQGFGARAHSTLGNPDFWGGYLILVIPFAMEQPALLALFLVALVLSQTRAAWLGFGAGALVFLLSPWRKRLIPAAGIGLLALAIFSFPNPLNPQKLSSLARLSSSLQTGQSDARGRFFMSRVAMEVGVEHPVLGAGSGYFESAFLFGQAALMNQQRFASEPYRYTKDAHNDWLQLAAESGFLALFIFAALVFSAGLAAWRSRQWALAALLASFSVNALLHFPLAIVPSAALIWLGLGWALAHPALESETAWRWRAWICLIPVLSAALFMRQWQASSLLNSAMNQSLSGNTAPADSLLRASLRLNDDERAWSRLGLNADARGDLAGAELAFSHCQNPEGFCNLGLVQAKSGKLAEARASSLKALELNPKSIEALGNLGKIEYLQGDVAAAEADYLKGLAFNPAWSQGRFNLAAIYINTRRPHLARPQLQELLTSDPGNAEASRLLRGLK